MKQYHLMRLYQVTKAKGYIESGEMYQQLFTIKRPGKESKIEMAYTLEDTNRIIMVERISPYLVKEVKTGIIFPIVNFKKKNKDNKSSEYLYSAFRKVHTFVCSRENKLLSKKVNLLSEIEEYDRLYSNNEAFKEELLEVVAEGKEKFDCKLAEETQIKKENVKKKIRQ